MSRTVPLLRRYDDPETSRDPRVRAVVDGLADLDYAPAPRDEFRAELREQLVAIAARVLDETEAGEAAEGAIAATPRAAAPMKRPRRRFVRPLGIATACVAVLAVGFGGVVWKSQGALPGDSLYGLKRASESVRLSLTSGDTDRGDQYLHLASTRVHEARDLLGHDSALGAGTGVLAAGVSGRTVSLIRSTLQSANHDVTEGAYLLNTQARESHSPQPLSIMTTWAPGQLHLLNRLATAVGDSSAQAAARRSMTLVQQALQRANELRAASALRCRATAPDRLGPTPCASSGTSTPTPTVVPSTTTPEPSSAPSTAATTRSRSHGGPARHSGAGSASARPQSGSSTSGPAGPTTSPTPTKPSIPTLPSVSGLPTKHHHRTGTKMHLGPVAVSSCGARVSLRPIVVSVGTCPTGH